MSVNYKQGINGVCKAVFVFVAHRLHRCHSKRRQHCQNHTVPRSIPIGDQASAAEKKRVRRGVVETITHRCTETELRPIYASLSARQKSPTEGLGNKQIEYT